MAKVKKHKTQKSKIEHGLSLLGWASIDKSAKYDIWTHPDQSMKFLVGKSGALRRTPGPISQSVSMTGLKLYSGLLQLSEAAEAQPELFADPVAARAWLNAQGAYEDAAVAPVAGGFGRRGTTVQNPSPVAENTHPTPPIPATQPPVPAPVADPVAPTPFPADAASVNPEEGW